MIQVDLSITPGRFWALVKQTSQPIQVQLDGKIYYPSKMINPVAFIEALQQS